MRQQVGGGGDLDARCIEIRSVGVRPRRSCPCLTNHPVKTISAANGFPLTGAGTRPVPVRTRRIITAWAPGRVATRHVLQRYCASAVPVPAVGRRRRWVATQNGLRGRVGWRPRTGAERLQLAPTVRGQRLLKTAWGQIADERLFEIGHEPGALDRRFAVGEESAPVGDGRCPSIGPRLIHCAPGLLLVHSNATPPTRNGQSISAWRRMGRDRTSVQRVQGRLAYLLRAIR